jgi:hypothetical protein
LPHPLVLLLKEKDDKFKNNKTDSTSDVKPLSYRTWIWGESQERDMG